MGIKKKKSFLVVWCPNCKTEYKNAPNSIMAIDPGYMKELYYLQAPCPKCHHFPWIKVGDTHSRNKFMDTSCILEEQIEGIK